MPARGPLEPIVHGHFSTFHDRGVALLTSSGEIVVLASERIDRYRHSWDARQAYDYLRGHPRYAGSFGGEHDRFAEEEDGDHHLFHAAASFFSSGFSDAAVVVVDGQGPRGPRLATTTIWDASGGEIALVEDLSSTAEHGYPGKPFAPESIGHFYTAIGALAGMEDLFEEGKTMGLAAYGRPSEFLDWLRERAYARADGSYHIDSSFVLAVFAATLGARHYQWEPAPEPLRAVWREATELRARSEPAGDPPYWPDVAFAGQAILEEIVVGVARRAHASTGRSRLCLSGGVALNCIANERIAREGPFRDLYVGPVPGDDGQALGKLLLDVKRLGASVDTRVATAYLGPVHAREDFEDALHARESDLEYELLPWEQCAALAVDHLCDEKVVALVHGRSEAGPRALGHRSLLADPRPSWMRRHINRSVKEREWFRPLAPVVLEERAADYFDVGAPVAFMERAVRVLDEQAEAIPAVTHVDGSARVQTLNEAQDPCLHRLLTLFYERTGIPVLLNTSFNRRGEPLPETPDDALDAFLAMNVDLLVLGDWVVRRR